MTLHGSCAKTPRCFEDPGTGCTKLDVTPADLQSIVLNPTALGDDGDIEIQVPPMDIIRGEFLAAVPGNQAHGHECGA